MQAALEQARQAAALGEVPVGAVVVKNGQILAAAHNLVETNSDPTAHAEVLAIRAAAKKLSSFRLEQCSLYVTLEPCPMCAGAAANARMAEIVFGAGDPVKGAAGGALNLFYYNLPNKPQVYGGVMEQECKALLQQFFKTVRKHKSNLNETN